MEINNLTEEQVQMLDFMWNELDTEQDFLDWYDLLTPEDQQMADSLQRLVIMECIDNDVLTADDDMALARSVIDKFRL